MVIVCECKQDKFHVELDLAKNELIFWCVACGEKYHSEMLLTVSKVSSE